jgi:hypothetical protein
MDDNKKLNLPYGWAFLFSIQFAFPQRHKEHRLIFLFFDKRPLLQFTYELLNSKSAHPGHCGYNKPPNDLQANRMFILMYDRLFVGGD